MPVTFGKAVKQKSKLRMALYGPSGSGKTMTALKLATVLAGGTGRVALIDTEHGSAEKYADKFDFDTLQLSSFHPQNYIDAIAAAEEAEYAVLIIDSLSHAWAGKDGALELVDRAARKSNSGSFAAWKDVTPIQNAMVDKMIGSNLHIIATMRSKVEHSQERDEKGKTVIKKLGTVPIQRSEVEYEFDIVGQLDLSNTLTIEKSRMSDIAGAIVDKPDGKLAQKIAAWLNEGAASAQSDQQRWASFCKQHGFTVADIEAALGVKNVGAWMREHDATLDSAMDHLLAWGTAVSDQKREKAAAGK